MSTLLEPSLHRENHPQSDGSESPPDGNQLTQIQAMPPALGGLENYRLGENASES